MTGKKKGKPTIEGIIIPSTWDDDGNVKGISIYANDEKEYLVEQNSSGKELLNHIHEAVEVIGKIRERLDGRLLIGVRSYRTIKEKSANSVAST